jgi:methanethiol oxidase
MALWKPDPTFYPSPGEAAAGPQEHLAYVAASSDSYCFP